METPAMDVQIVIFPETKVAVLEHRGPPEREHETAQRLIEWRLQNRLPRDRHRSYGVHYTDPRTTPPADHRGSEQSTRGSQQSHSGWSLCRRAALGFPRERINGGIPLRCLAPQKWRSPQRFSDLLSLCERWS